MAAKPRVSDPQDPKLWCKEASTLMEKEDWKGAIYCYEQAVRRYPKDSQDKNAADVWFNIGCLYEKCGSVEAAGGCFAASARRFLTDPRFPAEYARILASLGKYDEALKAIDEALEIDPYNALLNANRAGYLICAQKPNEALVSAEKALGIDVLCVPGYLHKAHALMVLGKTDEAVSVLEEASGKVPDEPRILKMQANVFIRGERYQEALDATEKLVLLLETDDAAWCLKGAAHAYLNQKDEAEKAFRRAVKLNPKEKAYRENLAAVRKM